MEVGIRELKAKLSEYIARAADGVTVVVTDRGRPVAKLVPVNTTNNVGRGIDEGWIEAPRRTKLSEPVLFVSPVSVLEALDEDRG